MKGKRGQIGWDNLLPWIIGIFVLALMLILIGILSGKGLGIIDYLKNLFRFGR